MGGGCPKTYVRHTKNRQIGLLDRKKQGGVQRKKKMLLDHTHTQKKEGCFVIICSHRVMDLFIFFKLLFAVGSYGDTFPCSWPSI